VVFMLSKTNVAELIEVKRYLHGQEER
jgi:hypothetical protein